MDALTTEGDARKRRQTAGCNAGTAKAYGQRAWWKLPRGIRRILGVGMFLRVLRRLTAGLGGRYRQGFGAF